MAKVGNISAEAIELARGRIDYYMLRGILPISRRWPKKPKPPYTQLQATGMAVFSIAASSMRRLSTKMRDAWKASGGGKRSQWPDSFKAIALKYWKLTRTFPLIALDYEVIETATTIKVIWSILEVSLLSGVEEKTYNITTDVIAKSGIEMAVKPIVFTLLDDSGNRQVAPFILYLE